MAFITKKPNKEVTEKDIIEFVAGNCKFSTEYTFWQLNECLEYDYERHLSGFEKSNLVQDHFIATIEKISILD